MQLLSNLINAIATPVRQVCFWVIRLVPGLRAIANGALPLRVSLMTLLFLLIIWLAAAIKRFWTSDGQNSTWRELWMWIGGALLGVIVIPIIVYYFTKYLLLREESRFPEIDRIWYDALAELERQKIDLANVPIFLVLGTPNIRFANHLLKIADLELSVTVPKQSDGDISVAANSDAIFVSLSGCSCLSRLSAMPAESMTVSADSPVSAAMNEAASRTIDPSFFASAAGRADDPSGFGARIGGVSEASPGATLLLPEDQDFSDLLRSDEPTTIAKPKSLSSSDMVDCEERLRHVCGLIAAARGSLCPINGILSAIPFETIQSSSPQLQIAAQKDLAVLRERLMVRCGNTVLVTDMEFEEGFQELINRFGAQRSRDFRFGKGCELWSPPEMERLAAVGAHATGAFEDWIYMLFQEEAALKRRYNSKLFMLLGKIRGQFSRSLADFLAHGFGFDPKTQPSLAYEQFLFGGCYFAATGTDPSRQAFVRSVIMKLIEQDGQLEWAPAARRIDQQYQFFANLAVLVGAAAVVAIMIMLGLEFAAPKD
jgi:hypothetical protein